MEHERMSQRATTPAPAPASHSPASAPVPVPAPFTASTQQSPTSALVPVEAPYTTPAQQAPASALVPLAAPFTAPAQQSPASAPVPLEAPFTAPAQQSPASAPARVPAQAPAPAPARSPRSQLIAVATRVVTRTHLKAMFVSIWQHNCSYLDVFSAQSLTWFSALVPLTNFWWYLLLWIRNCLKVSPRISMLAEGARFPSSWRVKVSPWRDGTPSVPQMAAWLLLPGGKSSLTVPNFALDQSWRSRSFDAAVTCWS